ncbi:MAG: hypothetical protein KIT31_17910 [Deltaproteobacteria bacterium]|nr:hypothetical protein [Deltaproteobacteria bacterium]
MRRLAALACLAACGGDPEPPPPDASIVGVPGTYEVRGIVRYEDRPATLENNKAVVGAAVPMPARAVGVAVLDDATGAMLAEGTTGEDGAYALSFDALGGQDVHILVVAQSTTAARPLTVSKPGNLIHGFGGQAFRAGLDTAHDVLVTEASKAAQAFNIFDVCLHTLDRVRSVYGVANPVPLTVFWSSGSNDGTYYDGNAIHLLGSSSDDDGYDDTVILHETGHYVEDKYGRSDSPGGSHGGAPTDPRLAWSEGFSTYWAMAIRDEPVYIDTNKDGGFGWNSDRDVTKANPAQPLDQRISEDTVTQVLWDLGDAGPDDDDPFDGVHDDVLSVQGEYLRTATLRPVGRAGVDLVDFLDGWFLKAGLTACEGTRAIVTTTRTFPYDYAGPAGACPAP